MSEANRLAESKDPYSVYAAQDYRGVLAVPPAAPRELPDRLAAALRLQGSFDCARSFEPASLRMTEHLELGDS